MLSAMFLHILVEHLHSPLCVDYHFVIGKKGGLEGLCNLIVVFLGEGSAAPLVIVEPDSEAVCIVLFLCEVYLGYPEIL